MLSFASNWFERERDRLPTMLARLQLLCTVCFNPQRSSSADGRLPAACCLLCALSLFTVAVFPACEGCEKCDTPWQVYAIVFWGAVSTSSFCMQVQTVEGWGKSDHMPSLSLSLSPAALAGNFRLNGNWWQTNKKKQQKRNAKRVCRLCGYLFVCLPTHSIWICTPSSTSPGSGPASAPAPAPGPSWPGQALANFNNTCHNNAAGHECICICNHNGIYLTLRLCVWSVFPNSSVTIGDL